MLLRPKMVIPFLVLLVPLVGPYSPMYARTCVIQTFTIGSASGIVVDPNGHPLPGAQVEISELKARTIGHTVTDIDGSFHLTDIPPGKYDLRVKATGFEDAWLPIVVRRAKTRNVEEKFLRIVVALGVECMSASLIKK